MDLKRREDLKDALVEKFKARLNETHAAVGPGGLPRWGVNWCFFPVFFPFVFSFFLCVCVCVNYYHSFGRRETLHSWYSLVVCAVCQIPNVSKCRCGRLPPDPSF